MRSHLFSNTPVAVFLAVFEPVMTLKKRFGHINGSDSTAADGHNGRGQVCTKSNFKKNPLKPPGNSLRAP